MFMIVALEGYTSVYVYTCSCSVIVVYKSVYGYGHKVAYQYVYS